MATHKKQLPLVLLKALQPVINKNLSLIEPVISEKLIVDLKDRDEKSDFYFRLTDQKIQGNTLIFAVDFKPQDEVNVGNVVSWVAVDGVLTLLESWLGLIETYNDLETIYDDLFLKTYVQEFEDDFKLNDSDADIKPFSKNQQEFIFTFLNVAKEEINRFQKEGNHPVQDEFILLNDTIDNLKLTLTRKTKRQVFNQILEILARAKKIGYELGKEVFIQVSSNLLTKLISS